MPQKGCTDIFNDGLFNRGNIFQEGGDPFLMPINLQEAILSLIRALEELIESLRRFREELNMIFKQEELEVKPLPIEYRIIILPELLPSFYTCEIFQIKIMMSRWHTEKIKRTKKQMVIEYSEKQENKPLII